MNKTIIMKRVKKDELERIVIEVMKKQGHVTSLNQLREKVLEEIRKYYPEASVSLQRLRETMRKLSELSFKIHVKKIKKDFGKEQEVCPICGEPLKKIYVKTLNGKKVFKGVECEKCSLFSETKNFAPARYEIYILRKKHNF